jgi:ribonuclease E
MPERFRIELVRIGWDTPDETLVALEGSAELVGRMAGGLVAEAVGAERAATTVVMPSDRPADAGEPEQPKRKRRTKAEIAADEAAAKLAEQRVADGAPVTQQLDAPVESAPAASSGPAPAAVPPVPPPVASGSDAPPYDPFA